MKEQEILQKLIGKVFPVDTFEDEMAKLLHSRKIEWSNLLTDIWDGKEWRRVNYRITIIRARKLPLLSVQMEARQ